MSAKIEVVTFTRQVLHVDVTPATAVKDVVLAVADSLGLGHAAPLFTLCAPTAASNNLSEVAKDACLLAWEENLATVVAQQSGSQHAGTFFLKRRVFTDMDADLDLGGNTPLSQLTAVQVGMDLTEGLYPDVGDIPQVVQLLQSGNAALVNAIASNWPCGTCRVLPD